MINNLQVLRAIAVIIVIIFHTVERLGESFGEVVIFSNFFLWGASGVDLFFVISGFIMVYIQNSRPRSGIDFLKSRAARILPIYYIVTIGWAAVIFVTDDFSHEFVPFEKIAASLLFSSQFLGMGFPFIPPGWTLEFEALFYVLFGLSLLLTGSSYLVAPTIVSLCFLFGLNLVALEFLLGMAIGLFYFSKWRHRAPAYSILGMGGALWVFTFFWQINPTSWNGLSRVIFWGIPTTAIVLGAVQVRQVPSGFLTYIGAASYSIYITHWSGLRIFDEFYSVTSLQFLNADLSVFLCTIFCIIAGCIFYSVVEKPIAKVFAQGASRSSTA